jgi:hypothetical protein
MTPEQAFNIIAQVVDGHLCNKNDRIILERAMQTIAALIEESKKKQQP